MKIEMLTNNYFSYLMRIWQEDEPRSGCWCASLEDPSTQQVTYFGSIEALFEFIRQKSYQDGNQINVNHDQNR